MGALPPKFEKATNPLVHEQMQATYGADQGEANVRSAERDAEKRVKQRDHEFSIAGPEVQKASGRIATANGASRGQEAVEKEKRKAKAAADRAELLAVLSSMEREMDWLESQMQVELNTMQLLDKEIEFLRGLNEDNIYDKDGALKSEVQDYLESKGYKDVGDMDAQDVMLALDKSEVEAHENRAESQRKYDDYQGKHDKIKDRVRDMDFEGETPEKARDILEREAPEVAQEVEFEAQNAVVEQVAESTVTETKVDSKSSGFSMGGLG